MSRCSATWAQGDRAYALVSGHTHARRERLARRGEVRSCAAHSCDTRVRARAAGVVELAPPTCVCGRPPPSTSCPRARVPCAAQVEMARVRARNVAARCFHARVLRLRWLAWGSRGVAEVPDVCRDQRVAEEMCVVNELWSRCPRCVATASGGVAEVPKVCRDRFMRRCATTEPRPLQEVCHDPLRRCATTEPRPRCAATPSGGEVCHDRCVTDVAELCCARGVRGVSWPRCVVTEVWPLQEVCRGRGVS